MFNPSVMSNSSLSEEASVSSGTRIQDFGGLNPVISTISSHLQNKIKKKRNLPGNPDPDAEVIALSPKTLLATNRFVCEICNKGFQRDQNLQLHRRGHNLPWKLKQRSSKDIKKRAYVCPEPSCVHHHPSRALGDLTGIKKHFCRKHGEKKWKCEKCSKIYAVQSDWKAHSKTCGTREYRCDCGTIFSRKDSFITHRAFCDALAEESARLSANQLSTTTAAAAAPLFCFPTPPTHISLSSWDSLPNPNPNNSQNPLHIKPEHDHLPLHHLPPLSSPPPPLFYQEPPPPPPPAFHSSPHLSATALLQKAASIGSTTTAAGQSVGSHMISPEYLGLTSANLATWQKTDSLTRDFLGLTNENGRAHMLTFTGGGGVEFQSFQRDHRPLIIKTNHAFGFPETTTGASETWGDC